MVKPFKTTMKTNANTLATILATKSPATQAFFASIMEANFTADLRAAIRADCYARFECIPRDEDDTEAYPYNHTNKYGVGVELDAPTSLVALHRSEDGGAWGELESFGFLGHFMLPAGAVADGLLARYGERQADYRKETRHLRPVLY